MDIAEPSRAWSSSLEPRTVSSGRAFSNADGSNAEGANDDGQRDDGKWDGRWAQKRHLQNLIGLRNEICWKEVASNSCCLCCLADRPQHNLTCGHGTCDACVRRFGRLQDEQEYCYSFATCPLCGTASTLRIILQPPTAGLRVLSVDGGGVRGVVPLQFLKLLQHAIGRAGQIQDYFDIGFGVSAGEFFPSRADRRTADVAGALVVYALLGLGWDVDRCIRFFRGYATRTLDAPLVGQKLGPGSICSLVPCLLSGGHYNPESVSRALQECMGSGVRLFDYPMSKTSRCKIAVTTTRTDSASTVLFPNYNISVRDEECRSKERDQRVLTTYDRFLHDRPEAEPRLWEV